MNGGWTGLAPTITGSLLLIGLAGAETPPKNADPPVAIEIDDRATACPQPSEPNAASSPEGDSSSPTTRAPQVAPSPSAPKPKVAPAFPTPKTLPPTGPYKALFFQNDFSYRKSPHEHFFGEELKGLGSELFGEQLTISTGGEVRHRFMNEDNRLRPGGPVETDYQLWRWRQYVDTKWGDLRIYFEGIDAESFGSEAPDQAIDVNRWDVLNLFVDWKFFDNDFGAHTLRYGRQELLFGRQRLVSPLDWANTRRNFEGLRYLLKGQDFTFDAFAVNPVNSATGFRSVAEFDNAFDQPNRNVLFTGAYGSFTGWKNTVAELYWLYLDTGTLISTKPDGQRHTIGSHWAHLYPMADESRVWDFDAEGALQVGEDNSSDVFAGFVTSVVGHTWKEVTWSPRISGLFYYGSGDRKVGSGHNNTLDVLFPLGHAYWGISDNVAGQNLFDYSVQVDVKPTKKTAATAAMHWLSLASDGDTLYNIAGVPVGTPGNGRDVGQTLDLYGYYAVNPNLDLQVGYSWFWYGSYIERTTPRGDASQFYVQTSTRY